MSIPVTSMTIIILTVVVHCEPMTVPFTLAGLPFATATFELTGSYVPAFAILMAGFALALILLTRLRMPAD